MLKPTKNKIDESNSALQNGKRIIKYNKRLHKKKIKPTPPNYSYVLVKEIPSQQYYHLFGDFFIDLEQLQDMERIKAIQPVSYFKKTVSVIENKVNGIIEVTMEKDAHGMKEFGFLIHMLRSMQNDQLVFLIQQLEYYQQLIIQCGLLKDQEQQTNTILPFENNKNPQKEQHIPLLIHENSLIKEEWNFQLSLQLAYRSIHTFTEMCKGTNDFFVYTIHRGNQYEQNIEITGYPKMVLEEFLCLNSAQMNFILLRRPFITPKVLQSRYLDLFFSRTEAFQYLFSENKSLAFPQNEFPIMFKKLDKYDLLTIDNIKVSYELTYYIQNLSNYKNKCSDQLFIIKHTPIGNFSTQEIIRSQRYFKQNISQKDMNTPTDPNYPQNATDELNFFDIVYDAKSELFKEKFYNLIDNDQFHDINEFLQ